MIFCVIFIICIPLLSVTFFILFIYLFINIIVENLKKEDITFGKFDVGDDFLLVNHILLLGKY